MKENWSRRRFLTFMGKGYLAVGALNLLAPFDTVAAALGKSNGVKFKPLQPTDKDDLVLAEGFTSQRLLTFNEPIGNGLKFGYNNDFIGFIADKANPNEGYLWVNHETQDTMVLAGQEKSAKKTRARVIEEQEMVGGSIVRMKKVGTQWQALKNDPRNKRISGRTKIAFAQHKIKGAGSAMGTLGNCSGGVTPWNTFLSAEENYDLFYGETQADGSHRQSVFGWEKEFKNPPEHYGWIVEVDPVTGKSKKHVNLGRFAHEGANTNVSKDGRCVVYMGDDASDRCLYKFVSDKPNSLDKGTLYVADLKKGQWLPIDRSKNAKLKKAFRDHADLMIHTRKAAEMVGGTPLDRPEGIAIAKNNDVFLALTNNKKKGNFYGSILRVREQNKDPLATKFKHETLAAGGPKTGFACPDNVAFDRNGNLWMTSDISGGSMNKPPYKEFKNNGLFYIPLTGPSAGKSFQVASAPRDAELTGPCFSPDGETMFLSVQHPGERSKSVSKLTSHWPEGGTSVPKPAVVALSGPALKKLMVV